VAFISFHLQLPVRIYKEKSMDKLGYCIAIIVLYSFTNNTVANNSVIESENTPTTNAPNFENGVLTIPRVDTPNQVGIYQDAKFQFDQQLEAWILQQVNSLPNLPFNPIISSVDVFVYDGAPLEQVFLVVTGRLPSTCLKIGQINIRKKADLFEVQVSVISPPPGTLCPGEIEEFVRVIQLDVHRLSTGDYRYSINGGNFGTFTLTRDNIFANECGGKVNPNDKCIIGNVFTGATN